MDCLATDRPNRRREIENLYQNSDVQTLQRLAGHGADQFEIFVEVNHYETRQFGGRRDQEVRNRRGSVMPAIGEHLLHLHRAHLYGGGEVLGWHRNRRRTQRGRSEVGP